MKKFQVKLDLKKKNVAAKIEFGRHVVTEMTGNSNFTTPSPTLLIIKGATDALETANDAALGGGTLATATLHLKEQDFDLKITALGDYVNGIAQGSETIIKSAGMETRKLPAPAGLPAQVVNLLIKFGLVSGELILRWKKVDQAKIYFVYMSPDADNDATYELVATVTAARYTAKSLTVGKTYWFKVKAVGTAGAGQLSDPAKMMVV